MTVIKNKKSNTYEVRTYYKDWTGVRKQKTKRGFKRKCDAQEWERAFKLKENLSLDMYFEDFVDLYLNDIKSRIKYNTWLTKKHIVEKKILPYFSKKKLQEIKPSDIRQWQNTMMNYRNKQGEGYSQVYLKTIHNQLSAILNHAVNFYDLKSNADQFLGSMGYGNIIVFAFGTLLCKISRELIIPNADKFCRIKQRIAEVTGTTLFHVRITAVKLT